MVIKQTAVITEAYHMHTHTHTVSSNLLSSYILYVNEITVVHHCRFQCNR